MQRNTRRINANHWMEVKTNGGMDELCHMDQKAHFSHEETSNRLGRATPRRPSHNGG
jgi:hypothetical protein